MKKQNTEFQKALRKWTVVNCWSMGECDSIAMWKLDSKSDEGIAIQSTYRRLSDSFHNYGEDEVYIGIINYIDYKKSAAMSNENFLFPFIHKWNSYQYEQELRALIIRFPIKENEPNYLKSNAFKNGLEVPVDLEKLVERVYISPNAGKWFEELLVSVMKKYNFGKPVTKSPLAGNPIF